MDSQIKLHLNSAKVEIPTFNCFSKFCTSPLPMAKAKKFTIKEGQVLSQSLSHYLAHIELFDYSFTQNTSIDFTIEEPSFFMYATLDKNSCNLFYRAAGKYQQMLPAGIHRVLLITFRSEWFAHKCQRLTELKSFATLINNPQSHHITLPPCGIAGSLFRGLKKMNAQNNNLNMDAEGYTFINSCINKYYNNLMTRNLTSAHHQHKAIAIAEFVKENYASELVDHMPDLAARFMVSERHMARLAKIAFGIPLHTQVIKIRMNSGLKHLFTTDKSIHEISRLIGYREPYYFSKAFKKHFGVSPKYLAER